MEIAREDFEAFKAGIKRLQELKLELDSLHAENRFPEDVAFINSRLKNVSDILIIEKKLAELKDKLSGKVTIKESFAPKKKNIIREMHSKIKHEVPKKTEKIKSKISDLIFSKLNNKTAYLQKKINEIEKNQKSGFERLAKIKNKSDPLLNKKLSEISAKLSQEEKRKATKAVEIETKLASLKLNKKYSEKVNSIKNKLKNILTVDAAEQEFILLMQEVMGKSLERNLKGEISGLKEEIDNKIKNNSPRIDKALKELTEQIQYKIKNNPAPKIKKALNDLYDKIVELENKQNRKFNESQKEIEVRQHSINRLNNEIKHLSEKIELAELQQKKKENIIKNFDPFVDSLSNKMFTMSFDELKLKLSEEFKKREIALRSELNEEVKKIVVNKINELENLYSQKVSELEKKKKPELEALKSKEEELMNLINKTKEVSELYNIKAKELANKKEYETKQLEKEKNDFVKLKEKLGEEYKAKLIQLEKRKRDEIKQILSKNEGLDEEVKNSKAISNELKGKLKEIQKIYAEKIDILKKEKENQNKMLKYKENILRKKLSGEIQKKIINNYKNALIEFEKEKKDELNKIAAREKMLNEEILLAHKAHLNYNEKLKQIEEEKTKKYSEVEELKRALSLRLNEFKKVYLEKMEVLKKSKERENEIISMHDKAIRKKLNDEFEKKLHYELLKKEQEFKDKIKKLI